MSLHLSEKDLENQDLLANKLITLAEIVVRKHFYSSINEKEDLVSIGVLKALTMINEGNFSKKKGNFATFIYTGMRNDMHNYLYHQNKFNLVDIDTMIDSGSGDFYFEDESCTIEYGIIHAVCMRFSRSIGDFLEDYVISVLSDNGYCVVGMGDSRPHAHNFCKEGISKKYDKETLEDIISRVVGIVLWKKRERM